MSPLPQAKETVGVQRLQRRLAVCERRSNWSGASQILEILCLQFPTVPRLRFKQAEMLIKAGDFKRASIAFKRAAEAYIYLGQPKMAQSVLHKAAIMIPSDISFKELLHELKTKELRKEDIHFHFFKRGASQIFDPNEFDDQLLEEDESESLEEVTSAQGFIHLRHADSDQQSRISEKLSAIWEGSSFLKTMGRDRISSAWQDVIFQAAPSGTVVFSEHENAPALLLLLKGSFTLTDIRTQHTQTLKAGDSIPFALAKADLGYRGEIAEDAELLFFPWSWLERIQEENSVIRNYCDRHTAEQWSPFAVRRNSVLGDLESETWARLQNLMVLARLRAGQIVISEGTIRDPILYLILEGEAEVTRRHGSPHQILLKTLKCGDVFGERSFLATVPSMATVIAKSPMRVLSLSKTQLDRAIEYFPQLTERLSKLNETRVQEAISFSLRSAPNLEESPDVKILSENKSHVHLFSGLTESIRQTILKSLTKFRASTGIVLQNKGDPLTKAYLLLKGAVKSNDFLEDGEEVGVLKWGTGQLIGDEIYFDQNATSAFHVEVTEDAELAEITETQLKDLATIHPQIATNLRDLRDLREVYAMSAQSEIFKDCSDHQLQLLKKSRIRRYNAGDVVINQGDPRDPLLYVILKGSVDVAKRIQSTDKILAELNQGQIFGESAMITNLPSSATVIAKTHLSVIEISRKELELLKGQIPSLTDHLVEVFRNRALSNVDLFIARWTGNHSRF